MMRPAFAQMVMAMGGRGSKHFVDFQVGVDSTQNRCFLGSVCTPVLDGNFPVAFLLSCAICAPIGTLDVVCAHTGKLHVWFMHCKPCILRCTMSPQLCQLTSQESATHLFKPSAHNLTRNDLDAALLLQGLPHPSQVLWAVCRNV